MGVATDLNRFYELLAHAHTAIGGYRYLKTLGSGAEIPDRGIFFFFEVGEMRHGGHDFRAVHAGTHALGAGRNATLWQRLLDHKGDNADIGGNHRKSALRKHIGFALLTRRPRKFKAGLAETWALKSPGAGKSNRANIGEMEAPLEAEVSLFVRNMPLLWVTVGDRPSENSHRGVLMANAVRLLGGARTRALDPPSKGWLGHDADSRTIRQSGLWNAKHVGEPYDPRFLDLLETYVEDM